MCGAERDKPCNGCTHMLDVIDGSARHVGQRAPLYVVAKSPIARLEAWAKARRWPHLNLLSDIDGSYSADYLGDTRRNKIGRVSCRERVCQYVWRGEVDVS